MSEKMDKFLHDWDLELKEGEKLKRGEWTSSGERSLSFEFSSFEIKHQVRGDKHRRTEKPLAHLSYEFTTTGKHPGRIIIGKMPNDDWSDTKINDDKWAIGHIAAYEHDTDLNDFYMIIALSKSAFDDLSRLLFSFKGKMQMKIKLQREIDDQNIETIHITGYELYKTP